MAGIFTFKFPRTIEGRELSLLEVQTIRDGLNSDLNNSNLIHDNIQSLLNKARNLSATSPIHYFKTRFIIKNIKSQVRKMNHDRTQEKKVIDIIKSEIALSQRIDRLQSMQKLFKYWHVAHLPFALIMLIIVMIHVVVTLALGYKWIF